MKFDNKEFSFYWKIIKIPTLLLVLWAIIAFIVAKFSMYWYKTLFQSFAGLILQIAIFAFVGYAAIAEHKGGPKTAAWAGALTGIIVGFIGAIVAIIMVNFVPEIIDDAVAQAVAQGAAADMVRNITNVMMYVGLVTGPLFGGLFGALISWISGLITKKSIK